MDLPWEDGLLERKTEGYDDEAFLKTMVAFANSVRPEHTAIILVGERDNGKIVGVSDPDKFQMRLHKIAKQIYPAIVWRSKVYEKDEKHCIRVEIEYSGETPHFGGIAWVRRGSETVKATDEVFQSLIALRSSKVRELAKWIGKEVEIEMDRTRVQTDFEKIGHYGLQTWSANLTFVNQFYATFQMFGDNEFSEPLERMMLSFNSTKKTLIVIVTY